MTRRLMNFGPGPAALPLPVLERARDELVEFRGAGMSILETSHRGPVYTEVHERTIADLRRLLGGAPEHEVLFMGGGARTQFAAVPMNLLGQAEAGYLVTGRWSEMALEAAGHVGRANALWSGADGGYREVPRAGDFEAPGDLAYLHYTSNNTIYGTQFAEAPPSAAPLVADMSSDLLSRPLALDRFGLIYAGAQKNLGAAGVTVVLARRDLLDRSPASVPPTLSYAQMAAKSSLLNTPPVYAIYLVGLMAEHLLAEGGLEAARARTRAKAEAVYHAIDASGGFYRPHAERESRSLMNVTFRLETPELEAELLAAAEGEGMVGLKGHRSVGGIRASLYNGVEVAWAEALAAFLGDFAVRRG